MKNILVAIDFRDNEKLLLDKAQSLASKFMAKVWLIHIAAPDPDFVGFSVGPQYIRDNHASELREEHRKLQDYADRLNDNDIECEGLMIQGATTEMILTEAKKLKIDLVITGHEEHGFFYKALYGSVSNKLIKESKIPILIVPLD